MDIPKHHQIVELVVLFVAAAVVPVAVGLFVDVDVVAIVIAVVAAVVVAVAVVVYTVQDPAHDPQITWLRRKGGSPPNTFGNAYAPFQGETVQLFFLADVCYVAPEFHDPLVALSTSMVVPTNQIMIIIAIITRKTARFWGTLFFEKPIWALVIHHLSNILCNIIDIHDG